MFELGQFGFSQQVPALAVGQVWPGLRMLDTGPGQEARPWTVTLGAMRYVGPPSGIVAVPGQQAPVDFSVDNAPQYVVRATWGAGGVSEHALIDWYTGGNSFTVFAESLSVDVFARAAQANAVRAPLLTAFVTPGRRSSDTRLPTFTTLSQNIPIGQLVRFITPERAVAYRIFYIAAQAANALVVTQARNDDTAMEYDNATPETNEAATASVAGLQSNRGAWWQLTALTQEILVQNNSGGVVNGVFAQFLLDLG